jgi:hypothetical protein
MALRRGNRPLWELVHRAQTSLTFAVRIPPPLSAELEYLHLKGKSLFSFEIVAYFRTRQLPGV